MRRQGSQAFIFINAHAEKIRDFNSSYSSTHPLPRPKKGELRSTNSKFDLLWFFTNSSVFFPSEQNYLQKLKSLQEFRNSLPSGESREMFTRLYEDLQKAGAELGINTADTQPLDQTPPRSQTPPTRTYVEDGEKDNEKSAGPDKDLVDEDDGKRTELKPTASIYLARTSSRNSALSHANSGVHCRNAPDAHHDDLLDDDGESAGPTSFSLTETSSILSNSRSISHPFSLGSRSSSMPHPSVFQPQSPPRRVNQEPYGDDLEDDDEKNQKDSTPPSSLAQANRGIPRSRSGVFKLSPAPAPAPASSDDPSPDDLLCDEELDDDDDFSMGGLGS